MNFYAITTIIVSFSTLQDEADKIDDIWLPPTPPPQDYDVFHMDPVLQSQLVLSFTLQCKITVHC